MGTPPRCARTAWWHSCEWCGGALTEPRRLVAPQDLRINAGSAIVLKGIGGAEAWERFKAAPHALQTIVADAFAASGSGTRSGDGGGSRDGGRGGGVDAGASGADAGASRGGVRVGQAFKPQLAGKCASFDKPVTKFPSGFYVEVKYDGERLQAHYEHGRPVAFYTRSIKPTPAHKVAGVAEALAAAFPHASRLVIDGEVVMRDPTGAVLAFGAQGVHEQKKVAGARCCLLIFDLLYYDGADRSTIGAAHPTDLTSLPLRKRRAALEAHCVVQPLRVELSSCKLMRSAAELQAAFKECACVPLERVGPLLAAPMFYPALHSRIAPLPA